MTRVRRAVAVAVVAAALSACGAGPDEPTATAACRAPERPPLQEGSHLIGDTPPPVPYSSSPPTSGWHSSGVAPPAGVYGTTLSDPLLVGVLERGGVVVAHRDELSRDELATATTLTVDDDVVVVSYPLPADAPPFAFAAWGTLQRCDELVADDVSTFVRAHADDSLRH